MNLYLESTLATHRHGRFFQAQLDAVPSDSPPESGIVLIHGNVFQAMTQDHQDIWWEWCKSPGRALLLMPPIDAGAIYGSLDWKVQPESSIEADNKKSLAGLVAAEVSAAVIGNDGEFDRNMEHQWSNFSVNTRFYKRHANSGLFAVTCLPLWSISLMDNAPQSIVWLENLFERTGSVSQAKDDEIEEEINLDEYDFATLIIAQLRQTGRAEELQSYLSGLGSALFRLTPVELQNSQKKLSALDLIKEEGPTEEGSETLEQSPYAIYAEMLAKEYDREAS